MKKIFRLFSILFFFQSWIFASTAYIPYQSNYVPANVREDFIKQNTAKYQAEKMPKVTLENLINQGVYNKGSTLTKKVTGTPNFNAILAADVCKVDNVNLYTSTIYSVNLKDGIVTCMFAKKGDLYNPLGLYDIFIPEVRAYYAPDVEGAISSKAKEIASAEAQFAPLLESKQQIASQTEEEINAGFLTIPELLLAAVLTDDEIIDIATTKATGKFSLNPGYTSKFTDGTETVDNTEYLLADAATIFEVYTGLSAVGMTYLLMLVVGFGVYGLANVGGGWISNKIEKKSGGATAEKTPYFVGLFLGVLLFFPVNQIDSVASEYEILKTRYQEFEKFGYYTFANWGKESAKVIIDKEVDAIIRKSGLATKDQIATVWSQKVQSDKMKDFYIDQYNYCLDNVYDVDKIRDGNNSIYSETGTGVFPSSENWAYATLVGKTMADSYYEVGEKGALKSGAATEGNYPRVAFSSCGKADYLSSHYTEQQAKLIRAFNKIVGGGGDDASKISMVEDIIKFQYGLYRDWGFLAVLGLPVTKMQTEHIGGLYETGESEILQKLNNNLENGLMDRGLHTVLSSMPYLLIPGAMDVFNVSRENAIVVGAITGGVAGVAESKTAAVDDWVGGAIGGILGGLAGATGAGAALIGLMMSFQYAKTLIALLPIVSIIMFGILRFVIIIVKIFSFHFISLFILPIIFLQRNIENFAKFTSKILATMLELPIFVLAVWLAVTAHSLLNTVGLVFGKKILEGMLDTSLSQSEPTSTVVQGFSLTELGIKMKIYVFDGLIEVAIAIFSVVVAYKIIVSLHDFLFQTIEISTSNVFDNAIESMKTDAKGWGARI